MCVLATAIYIADSCQQVLRQLPASVMAVARTVDGSCQNSGWQLPEQWMAVAITVDGSCQKPITCTFLHHNKGVLTPLHRPSANVRKYVLLLRQCGEKEIINSVVVLPSCYELSLTNNTHLHPRHQRRDVLRLRHRQVQGQARQVAHP